MNTARLKNIVILILLLANAFLLVLLFSRRAEENASHERSVAQLTALLNADGIAFDSALLDGLPDTVLSVQPARDLAAEQALAEGIIGSVTSIDSGGGIYRYYSSDGLNSGSCLIRSGGALEAAVSRAVDDPAEFCADLCVPLGYRTFDVLSDGARTVITASRFVGELEVCNASLIFTFSGSTLTTVTGTFLPPIDTSESGETALDAVTALVRRGVYRDHLALRRLPGAAHDLRAAPARARAARGHRRLQLLCQHRFRRGLPRFGIKMRLFCKINQKEKGLLFPDFLVYCSCIM